jgi:hypothetical protein
LLSPKRERPVGWTPAGALQSPQKRSLRSIGASRAKVNYRSVTKRHFPIVGVSLFALCAGAALYLVAHVVASLWGWQDATMFVLSGWLLTLVLLAGACGGRR